MLGPALVALGGWAWYEGVDLSLTTGSHESLVARGAYERADSPFDSYLHTSFAGIEGLVFLSIGLLVVVLSGCAGVLTLQRGSPARSK